MKHITDHYRIAVIRLMGEGHKRPVLWFETTAKDRERAEDIATALRSVYACVNVHKVTTETSQTQTAI